VKRSSAMSGMVLGLVALVGSLRKGEAMRDRLRATTLMAAVAATALAVLAMPASAGTTRVSGSSVYNTECQLPAGVHPAIQGITLRSICPGVWMAAGTRTSPHRSSTPAARI